MGQTIGPRGEVSDSKGRIIQKPGFRDAIEKVLTLEREVSKGPYRWLRFRNWMLGYPKLFPKKNQEKQVDNVFLLVLGYF
jgi:hypothetical protein